MVCVERVRGECPYREAYGCNDDVREIGLELGHCAVEQYLRNEKRRKAVAALEHVSWHMHEHALDLVELFIDAEIYSVRANVWMSLLFDRPIAEGGGDMAEEEHLRAVSRYRAAASSRLFRRYQQLIPVIEDARNNRRTGRRDRLRRIAGDMRREAEDRSKSA